MGSSRTKADCDREIAKLERELASWKSNLEQMKARPQNYTKEAIAIYKSNIERVKGEIKSHKAQRKTLK